MKQITIFPLLLILLLTACMPSVTPNEYVVVTADCWNHMRVVKAGEIPPRLLTTCDRKIILPAFLMDGQAIVPARFIGDVKGVVTIDYQYEIKDPIKFVSCAKFITSSKTDETGSINDKSLEKAENMVIDKITKDIVREYCQTVNPVDIDESKMEDELIVLINKKLEDRGIVMTTPSIDNDFKPQTEEALDVISAFNLYKNAGLNNLGTTVIENQAGKTVINLPSTKESSIEEKSN